MTSAENSTPYIFIDSRVENIEQILASLPEDAQVVLLDPKEEGLTQIAEALAEASNVPEIHLIAHGWEGDLWLGSSYLSAENLADSKEVLAQIGSHISEEGDLLLYSCNTAAGETGVEFVESLAEFTGADVAASNDRTGGPDGDWQLEVRTGLVEAEALQVTDYTDSLATLTVKNNSDSGTDSLREHIATAIAGDTITFDNDYTIQLTSGELVINKQLTIDGDRNDDGTADVTLDANHNSRVLNVSGGSSGNEVVLDGLIITKGLVYGDGGDYNVAGTDSLGGAINNSGHLIINHSEITSNKASGGGGGGGGGKGDAGTAGSYGGGGGGGYAGKGGGDGGNSSGGKDFKSGFDSTSTVGITGGAGNGGGGGPTNGYSTSAGGGGTTSGGSGTGAYFGGAGGGGGTAVINGANVIGGGGGGYGVGSPANPASGGDGGDAVGAIYNSGTLTINNTILKQNAGAGGGGGGAKNVSGQAGGKGGIGVGGIYNADGSTLRHDATLTYGTGANENAGVAGTDGGTSGTGLKTSYEGADIVSHSGATVISNYTLLSNAAPSIAVGDLSYTEGNTTQIDSSVTAADSDGDSDWDSGAKLEVQITGNNEAGDQLTIGTVGGITLSGSNVQYNDGGGAVAIGTISETSGTSNDGTVTNGDKLTVNFVAAATDAAVKALVEAIQYTSTSDDPTGTNSTRTVTYTLTDKNAGSSSDTSTITITPVNDAPVLADTSVTLTAINEDAGDDDGSGADNDNDATSNADNQGDTVANLLTAAVTDPDGSAVEAIAVTQVDNTNGVWQYTTDGSTWNNFTVTTGSSVDLETGNNSILLDSANKVRFVPDQNYSGSATFTFRAWDKSSGSAGSTATTSVNGAATAFSTATDTASVTINAIDDAPTLADAGVALAANEDTATAMDLTKITVADVDTAGDLTLTVAVADTSASLTATGAGTTVNSVDVVQTNAYTVTLTGTVAELNGYLGTQGADNLTYTTSSNSTSNDTLSITVNDGNSSSSATNLTIAVTGINDAPTITNSGNYNITAVNEETASAGVQISTILADGAISRNDVDSGANSGMAITAVTGTGTWEFSTDNTNWTSFGTVSASAALLLDKDSYVRFTGGSEYSGTATFSFKAWDQTSGTASSNGSAQTANASSGGGITAFSTNSATTSITVNAVDDAPVLAGSPTLAQTEDAAAAAMDISGVTISDVDTSGDITITLSAGDTSAALTATATGTVNSVDVTQVNAYTITLVGTVAELNGYLGTEGATNITYATSANRNTNDTLTIVANDGNSNSNSLTPTITIASVNDEPTVSATGDSGSAAGAGSAVSVFSSTSISAVDSGENIAAVTFTVSGLADSNNEKLIIDGSTLDLMTTVARTDATGNNIAYQVTYSAGTATVVITGPAGAAAANTVFQTALDGMTYQNTLGAVTTGNRVFTLTQVEDEGGTANGGDDSVTPSPVIVATINVVNGDTPLATTTSYNGTEDTGVDMATAGMAATREANAADTLDFITITGVTGGTLTLTGSPSTTGAAGTAGMASAGALNVGDKVSTADIALINFMPTTNSTTAATVTYTVTDSGNDVSTAGTITINLAAVDDAPTLADGGTSLAANEDVATAMDLSQITVADVDTTGDVTLTVAVADTNASLTATGAGTTVNNVDVVQTNAYTVTLTGTVSELNGYLGTQGANNLTYTTNANSTSNDTLSITANDGNSSSSPTNLTVTVTAVNDEPVVSATGTGGNSINGVATDLFNSTAIDVASPDTGDQVKTVTFTVSGLQDGADEKINLDSTAIVLTDGTNGTTGGSSLGYSVAVSSGTATVTITHAGIAEATIEGLLDAMTYQNTAAGFTEGARVVTITSVQDTGGVANSGDDTWSTGGVTSTVTVVDGTKPTATSYTDTGNEEAKVDLSATEMP
ncbi:MAG: hypothetical protein CMH98_01220, partial [Oceanospirillaceae bacterium]|nr:hypothetical protein [Oceanospirillaceae bacterium]